MNYLAILIGKALNSVSTISSYCQCQYKTKLVHHGINSKIGGSCHIAYPSNIYLGDNSYVNGGMLMASSNAKIIIGNNCMLSYNVHLRTDMHRHSDTTIPMVSQGNDEHDIVIGDDVWVGYGAQIMSGVTIGDGVIIGAGAVATKDIESYSVAVGVPAKVIKHR